MRKNIRGLALLALAYIAFWPVEYSVAQDQPRARELSRSGPVRVFRKRESPVLFSQEGEVRFQKAYVDQNGSIRADGHNLDLYGAVLIRRDRICTSAEGARWTFSVPAYSRFPETKVCGSGTNFQLVASRLSIASSCRASESHEAAIER